MSFGAIPELPVEFGELSRVAQELRDRAGVLPGVGAEAASTWDALEAVYQAPEAEELIAKMRSLVLVSADVGGALVRAADIMDQLADDLMWLAMRRRGLVDDAEEFSSAARGVEDPERASELEVQIERFATAVQERLDQARSDLDAIAPPPPWEVTIPDASPPPLGPRLTWSARTQARADDMCCRKERVLTCRRSGGRKGTPCEQSALTSVASTQATCSSTFTSLQTIASSRCSVRPGLGRRGS